MKILFCLPDMSIGGSSSVVYELIRNWPNKKDELFLLVFYDYIDPKYKFDDLSNFTLYKIGKKRKIDFPFIFRLKKIIKNISPDFISSHLTCTFYLKIINAQKKALVFHTVHSLPNLDMSLVYRQIIKRQVKLKRIILVGCCKYIAKKTSEMFKIDCPFVNNGVHTVESSSIFCKEQIEFLYVGRFDYMKNIPLLIEAFCNADNKNAILKICGYGPEEPNIKLLIEGKSNIKLIGKVDNMDEIYKNSDVVCLLSEWEGLPLVLLEGIQHGNCFLMSNVGGISEFVKDGKNGFLINDLNSEIVTDRINILCSNKELVEKMKKNSLSLKDQVSSTNMAKNYFDLFVRFGSISK